MVIVLNGIMLLSLQAPLHIVQTPSWHNETSKLHKWYVQDVCASHSVNHTFIACMTIAWILCVYFSLHLHCIYIVFLLCFTLVSSEQEEYWSVHTERWILSPKAPGAGFQRASYRRTLQSSTMPHTTQYLLALSLSPAQYVDGRANGIGHWVSLSVRTCQRQRSILQPPLHVQLLPVGNPVHSPFLHCIGWPAKEKVKP